MFGFTIILMQYPESIQLNTWPECEDDAHGVETAAVAEAEDGDAATDSSHLFRTLNIS